MITIDKFGKDHWSLLAYLETLVIDFPKAPLSGEIHRDRVRCNEKSHPVLRSPRVPGSWSPKYGTRLKDGKVLPKHDDWDCLDDLEAAGLCEIISLVNGFFKMTPKGMEVATQLRLHKANQGTFATFTPDTSAPKPVSVTR